MVSKIALEEHFLCPGSRITGAPRPAACPTVASSLFARLTDFGETRLEAMDRAGIARAVLSIAGPGVQSERDAAAASRRAREANDFLAREVAEASRPLFRLRASCRCRTRRLPPMSWSAACAT